MQLVEPSLVQAFLDLLGNFWHLIVLIVSRFLPYTLLILWITWWLLAVNWTRCWTALRAGGWAPLTLFALVSALVWSRFQPTACDCLGFVSIPNFWWQLGEVGIYVGSALFCGWLQGFMHWTPIELDLNPPAHAAGHDAHHGH